MTERADIHGLLWAGPAQANGSGDATLAAPLRQLGMVDAPMPVEGQVIRTATPTPSLRHALRAATSDAHARVDAAFSRLELACPADYRRFLAAQAGALLPLEAALDRAGAAALLPDWPARRRSAALLEDLRRLGQPPGRPLPIVGGGSGWVLGALYVLEGSRLGGQVLRRRVLAGPDAACRTATAYLSHGIGRYPWPDFVRVLDASPHGLANPASVVGGALEAFFLFEQAVQSRLPPEVPVHVHRPE